MLNKELLMKSTVETRKDIDIVKASFKKMMSDKKRSPQQIEEDRIKYFQRKTDFFKNYKKGKFIEES